MRNNLPTLFDRDAPVFTVTVAARLAGMHPQTLRTYDRLGLVVPRRAKGRGRRYSARDISQLRMIQHLSQEEKINLPGIIRILQLQAQIADQQRQIDRLMELVAQLGDRERQRVFAADASGGVARGVRRKISALPSSASAAEKTASADKLAADLKITWVE